MNREYYRQLPIGSMDKRLRGFDHKTRSGGMAVTYAALCRHTALAARRNTDLAAQAARKHTLKQCHVVL